MKIVATAQVALLLCSLSCSLARGQEAEKAEPEEKPASKTTAPGSVEGKVLFRWMELANIEGVTTDVSYDWVCPTCNNVHRGGFAHKESLDLSGHIKSLFRQVIGARTGLAFEISKEGQQKLARFAAGNETKTLGVFVGKDYVGTLVREGYPVDRPVAKLLPSDAAMRIYAAPGMPQPAPPKRISHFLFSDGARDEIGKDTKVEQKNLIFKDDALYVNGKYSADPDDADRAHRCRITTPSLKPDRFTVVVRFRPLRIRDRRYRTVLCGGVKAPWFHLGASKNGRLEVSLNNGQFRHETKLELKTRDWTTVVCQIDAVASAMHLRVNDKNLKPVPLPAKAFGFVDGAENKSEKVWSFVNKRSRSVFHGFVSELTIYNGTFGRRSIPDVKAEAHQPADKTQDPAQQP